MFRANMLENFWRIWNSQRIPLTVPPNNARFRIMKWQLLWTTKRKTQKILIAKFYTKKEAQKQAEYLSTIFPCNFYYVERSK